MARGTSGTSKMALGAPWECLKWPGHVSGAFEMAWGHLGCLGKGPGMPQERLKLPGVPREHPKWAWCALGRLETFHGCLRSV